MLKGDARAVRRADGRDHAVLCRFAAADAASGKRALGQLHLADGVALCLLTGQHRLAVFVGRQRAALAVLAGRLQHDARHWRAQGVHRTDCQLSGHRVAHHNFPSRHRDERLVIKEIALRRALLTQVEFRALRQREAGLPIARADAHGLAGIQRVCPRGQLARAGEDVHAKLRARQRVHNLRLVAASVKGEALHAQADGARGARRLHGGNVNIVAKALFLRRGRLSLGQHSAQQQRRAPCNRSPVHHISPSLQSRL